MVGVFGMAGSANALTDKPRADEELQPLPKGELFEWLIAEPREAVFSLRYLKNYTIGRSLRSLDEKQDVADVSLGEYFGLLGGKNRLGIWQLGLEAAVFSLFALDSPSLNLVNADYRLGLPLTAHKDRWSYRVNIFHQSSHLGDEFILQHPAVERQNLSYEAVDTLIAYRWQGLRPYVGASYIISSDQDLEPGWGAIRGGLPPSISHRPIQIARRYPRSP